jgi:enoyl-CoA hydratase/carnithine racemase
MIPALSTLHLTVDRSIARLELNHGKANEMGRAQLDDLTALCAWLETGAVRALVTFSRRTSSRGTAVFIAGANVTERAGWSNDVVKAHVRYQRATLARLRRVPVFHVAVVDGVALGWGTEFLLVCDYRIAAPGARFGLPETGLGILPGAGGSAELPSRIGLTQALRLGMTGEQIDAAEAGRIGLVDEVAPSLEAGLARAEALVARAATRSPTAMAAYKAAALAAEGLSGDTRTEIEARAYEHCVDTGEAAIGRASFAKITEGQSPAWGPLRPWSP